MSNETSVRRDLSTVEAQAWQQSWDRQQEGYLPDREHRLTAMLDVVQALATTASPAILDLAGGTGSISIRALRRLPGATTTLVDVDPVLMAIARGSLDHRSTVVSADLRSRDWSAALPHQGYDAVLTATALHWIPEERLAVLYREVHEVLRPGGVFLNADHMPDDALPTVNARLEQLDQSRRDASYGAGATVSWTDWWGYVERDRILGQLMARRHDVFGGLHAAEFAPAASWHIEALRSAGFAEAGVVWRGGRDAAVAAVRTQPS